MAVSMMFPPFVIHMDECGSALLPWPGQRASILDTDSVTRNTARVDDMLTMISSGACSRRFSHDYSTSIKFENGIFFRSKTPITNPSK